MASAGMGDMKTSQEYIDTAIVLEPGNPDYRNFKSRMGDAPGWYTEVGKSYGTPETQNNNVCLYFVLPEKFKGISAIGTIEEVTDMEIKKDFWQTGWLIYYHKGASDPDYTLLKFTSKYMHCWGNANIHNFGEPVNSGKKED